MENLIKAITTENQKEFNTTIERVIEIIKNKDFNNWYLGEYLTDLRIKQLKNNELSEEKAIDIIIKKATKKYAENLQKKIDKINDISEAENFKNATLTVEWTKSKMWGNNPQCELIGNNRRYVSSRIGGCGYDKESTATSEALNQFKSILNLMYMLKNDNIDKNNHELFGYGSGYGILPYFEGGVGISTMYDICKSIGLEFKTVSSGKTFDVYEIVKVF